MKATVDHALMRGLLPPNQIPVVHHPDRAEPCRAGSSAVATNGLHQLGVYWYLNHQHLSREVGSFHVHILPFNRLA